MFINAMDLLPEIYNLLLYYLSVDDLTEFRLIAKDVCEQVKRYEGSKHERIYPYSLSSCFQCFPNLKYLDATKCTVKEEDFQLFTRLTELALLTDVLVRREDLFLPCSTLTTLQLESEESDSESESESAVDPAVDPLDIDLVFQSLPHLNHLILKNVNSVTDHALLYLPHLKKLDIYDQSSITSSGIQGLQLTYLNLYDASSRIGDEAFQDLPLKELCLHNQEWITDQGILHLTQLKKLFCVNTRIQGIGFTALTQLTTVGIGEATVTDLSGFTHVRTLTFQNCHIICNLGGTWKNLKKLRFNKTTFVSPLSIQKIVAPQLIQLKYELCRCMLHEGAIRETFGTRVSFKN